MKTFFVALVVAGSLGAFAADSKAVCRAVEGDGKLILEAPGTKEAACAKAIEKKMLATCSASTSDMVIAYALESGAEGSVKRVDAKVH